MAFSGTLTERGGGEETGYASSYNASDAFAPAEGDLILVYIYNSGNRISGASAWSTSFTQLCVFDAVSGSIGWELWGCIAPSGASSESVVVAGTSLYSHAGTLQIAGADTSGTLANVFGQDPENGHGTDYQTGSNVYALPTLSAWSNADNLALTVCAVHGGSRAIVADGSFTLVGSAYTGAISTYGFCYFDGEDTTQNVAWTGSQYSSIGGVALEIKPASGVSLAPSVFQNSNQIIK